MTAPWNLCVIKPILNPSPQFWSPMIIQKCWVATTQYIISTSSSLQAMLTIISHFKQLQAKPHWNCLKNRYRRIYKSQKDAEKWTEVNKRDVRSGSFSLSIPGSRASEAVAPLAKQATTSAHLYAFEQQAMFKENHRKRPWYVEERCGRPMSRWKKNYIQVYIPYLFAPKKQKARLLMPGVEPLWVELPAMRAWWKLQKGPMICRLSIRHTDHWKLIAASLSPQRVVPNVKCANLTFDNVPHCCTRVDKTRLPIA